ncbi:MAG: nitroreductase [Deltaproteobacteria bacterium]|nr:nitroreductase [Deltaproteobacteria bacterium]
MSDPLAFLEKRASAIALREPGPPPELVERIVRAALRAPDHGALRPFRILLFEGPGRERLARAFVASAQRQNPKADPSLLEKERQKAFRAPLVFVVASTPRPHPKVPEIEQVLSAGCVAYGILLGLQAAGFGGMWRTGAPAYDPELKRELGLAPSDAIVGFIYAGTPEGFTPSTHRPTPESHLIRITTP